MFDERFFLSLYPAWFLFLVAGVIAPIAIHRIAVIAGFVILPHEPVAAESRGAGARGTGRTGIIRAVVSVVAGFRSTSCAIYESVSAESRDTAPACAVWTCIMVTVVPVVAQFEPRPNESISAMGRDACPAGAVRARIRGDVIPVVAQFRGVAGSMPAESVSADSGMAGPGGAVRTSIGQYAVSVITGFVQCRLHDAVSTAFDFAVVGAAVAVCGVSVVAFLAVGGTVSGPKEAVSASRRLAVAHGARRTGIRGVLVAIVTALSWVEVVVTAYLAVAIVGASVTVDRVSVVAFFAFISHAVAAPRQFAGRPAGVGTRIAVSSSVIAFFTLVCDSVAAAGKLAVQSTGVRLVRIGAAVVALFFRVHDFVAAIGMATGRPASVGSCVRVAVAVVAFFPRVQDAVAASRPLTVGTTEGPMVQGVEPLAGGVVRGRFGAVTTVAFFDVGADALQDSVAASGLAALAQRSAGTIVVVVEVVVVAFFHAVQDMAVSADVFETVGQTGSRVRVIRAIVAFFTKTVVHHAIAAVWSPAVWAAVIRNHRVLLTVVTFFA